MIHLYEFVIKVADKRAYDTLEYVVYDSVFPRPMRGHLLMLEGGTHVWYIISRRVSA